MNRIWTLTLAFIGGLALAGPVHADLLLDGFGDPQPAGGALVDGSDDGSAATTSWQPITDTDFTNVERMLTAELTNDASGTARVTSRVVDGIYEHTQSSGEDGYTRIDWRFDPATLNDPVNIFTDVLLIDEPADLLFTLDDGTNSVTKTASLATAGTTSHQFGSFDGLDMTSITSASLEISGADSLDMNLEFVEVPAPGVLGLLGLGLAGVGFFARRRGGEA